MLRSVERVSTNNYNDTEEPTERDEETQRMSLWPRAAGAIALEHENVPRFSSCSPSQRRMGFLFGGTFVVAASLVLSAFALLPWSQSNMRLKNSFRFLFATTNGSLASTPLPVPKLLNTSVLRFFFAGILPDPPIANNRRRKQNNDDCTSSAALTHLSLFAMRVLTGLLESAEPFDEIALNSRALQTPALELRFQRVERKKCRIGSQGIGGSSR